VGGICKNIKSVLYDIFDAKYAYLAKYPNWQASI